MPKKTAEVEITLRFLHDGAKQVQEHLKLVTQALGGFKGALKGIDADKMKLMLNSIKKDGTKANETLKDQQEQLIKVSTALDRTKRSSDGATSSYRSFMSSMRDGVFLMEMFYRWTMRVVRSLIRLGQGLVQIVQEYAEFIRTVRSASFILRTSIENVVEATKKTTELGISMSEAAHGLDEFGRAGYTANDAIKAYTPIAIFAKAVNTNLSRATTLVTGAMKSFGFEAQDVWRIASGMTNAVYKSRNSFETLETAFAYAGASGAAFGQEFESVLSAIMAFRDLGLKASTSGTVFRRALSRLGAATKPTREAFQSFGIDIEKFTVSSDRSFAQVIRNFVKVRETMSELDFNELMSKAIGPRFAAYLSRLVEATKEGRINMEKAADDLKNSMKTLFNLTKYNMSTITHQIDTFNAVMERAKFAFGKDLANTFSPYIAAFNIFANKILDKWETTGKEIEKVTDKTFEEMSEDELAKRFENFSKKIDMAMVKIIDTITEVIYVLDEFRPVINTAIAFITIFITTLAAIPAGLAGFAALVVTAFSSLITILETKFDIVTDIFSGVWETIKEAGERFFSGGWKWLTDPLKEMWNDVIDVIQSGITKLFYIFNSLGDRGKSIFKKVLGMSDASDNDVRNSFSKIAKSLTESKYIIKKPADGIVKILTDTFNIIKNNALSGGGEIIDKIKNMFGNIANSNSVKLLKNLGDITLFLSDKIKNLLSTDASGETVNSLVRLREILKGIREDFLAGKGLDQIQKEFDAAMKRGMTGGQVGAPMTDESVYLDTITKQYETLREKLESERFGMTAALFADDEFEQTTATWDDYIELNKLYLEKLKYEMKVASKDGVDSSLYKSIKEEYDRFEKSNGFIDIIKLKESSLEKLEKVLNKEKNYYEESGAANIAVLLDQEEKVAKFYDDHYKKIKEAGEKAKKEKQDALDKELQEDLKKHAAYYKELEKMRFKDLEYAKTLGNEQLSAMTERFKQLEEGQDIGPNWRRFLEQFDVGSKKYAQILQNKALNTQNFAETISLSLESAARSWGTTREILSNTTMQMANTLQSGLQSIFTSLIDKTKDVKDAFKDMGKSILASLMAALSKMLVQRLIYSKLTQKLEKKHNIATGKITAGKAVLSAIARGWEMGPGITGLIMSKIFAGIATAQTGALLGSMAGTEGYFNGTSMAGVPGTFTGRDNRMAPVSPGEVILDNNASDVFRNMAAGKGNMGGNSYMFNVYATDYESFKNKSEEVMIEAFTGNAKIRRAMKKSLKTQG